MQKPKIKITQQNLSSQHAVANSWKTMSTGPTPSSNVPAGPQSNDQAKRSHDPRIATPAYGSAHDDVAQFSSSASTASADDYHRIHRLVMR